MQDSMIVEFDRTNKNMVSMIIKATGDEEKAEKYGSNAKFFHYFCVIKIKTLPQHLLRKAFVINGIRYQWISLAELKTDLQIRKYNNDVIEFITDRYDATLVDLESAFNERIQERDLIFVIAPLSTEMESIFEGVKAAGEAYGCRVERVVDVVGDYKITDKILEMIYQATIIVADLSHERPNVYFELGYARGICKTVITIDRESTKLHFDVKDWTCIFYNDSRKIERELLDRLKHELKNI
ncbi:hypothetical protein C5S42_02095 [Candidatus Methanomarinus sp.]|nr:hypothetical protein C5S42_02095 [ANME-2 cluster archaeon]